MAHVFLLALLMGGQARAGQGTFILVLHSYHHGFSWTDSIQRGVESAVARSPEPRPELFVEYLDAKRFPPDPLFPGLVAEYRAKYGKRAPGVIISTDDIALNFILDHGRELFPMVPVVFCGVNNFQEARIAGRPEMTGVLEDFDLEGNLKLALKLFPKAKTAAVIADGTQTGALNMARFRSIAPRYADTIHFLELAGLSSKELGKALRALPANAIVLNLGLFRDKDGRAFTIPEGAAFIREHTAAPVFSFWDFYLGEGIVGGRLVSGDMQGRAAAEMALKILSGVPPSSIPILHESPNRYMFDHQALVRVGLSSADLPEGSEIMNLPDTFTRRYKKEIIAAAITFCAMLLLIGVMTANILQRKKAQAELGFMLSEWRAIFDNSQVGILVLRGGRKIHQTNQRLADILGYNGPEELRRLEVQDLHISKENFEIFGREHYESLRSGRKTHVEYKFRRKDGTTFWGLISGKAVNPADLDQGVVWVIDDITDRKRAERALADMNRTLEEQVRKRTRDLEARSAELEAAYSRLMDVDRLKSALLSTVSHDLRTPLTSILGFAKIIQRDLVKRIFPALDGCEENLSSKMKRIDENLSIIVSEGSRLTRLINDLLDLSKIEAGRMEWSDREISAEAIVTEAVKAVSGEFMALPEVALTSSVAPGLPPLQVDPDRMAQVLINLLNNAAKFTDRGTVSVKAMPAQDSKIEIVVRDTGAGMPREELVKVFDRFHKIERGDVVDSSARGSGLGLAICKEIVQHYAGRIWAESAPGKGSAFHIELPAAKGGDAGAPEGTHPA